VVTRRVLGVLGVVGLADPDKPPEQAYSAGADAGLLGMEGHAVRLVERPDGKVHLVRVTAAFENDGRCHVRSVGAQGSHQLAATALAAPNSAAARSAVRAQLPILNELGL